MRIIDLLKYYFAEHTLGSIILIIFALSIGYLWGSQREIGRKVQEQEDRWDEEDTKGN